MNEPCEFDFVLMKRAVRDSVAQIGNHTSKSEASIQSETALNAGETETSLTDRLEAEQQREHKDIARLLDTRTSSRRRLQYQEGQELRKYWKYANHCYSTAMLLKLQDWYSTDSTLHYKMKADEAYDGSGEGLQPRYTEIRCRLGDTGTETGTGTETETDSCQCWSWTSRRVHKLSEAKERWTSLGHFSRWTDHDSNEQSKSKARATSNAKFREYSLVALLGEQLLEPNDVRGWQREQTLFQDQAVRVHGPWWSLRHFEAWTLWVGRRAFFRVWRASLASKGAICARGGVLKFWHVVNNDTNHARCTYLHSCLQCTVLIKCSICSYPHWMRTLREWLKKQYPRHMTHRHINSSCLKTGHILFNYCLKKKVTIFNYCFEYCLNAVLKNSEILSNILSPLHPLNVNIFQLLFALLFVRGVFLLLQMIAQTIAWWSSPWWSRFYIIACVRTCLKLASFGSGLSGLIARWIVRP